MHAQMLVGMVAMTGQWWLDACNPRRVAVLAHLVHLAWYGLSSLVSISKLGPSSRRRR